jgi:hypothetical protein
MNRIQSLNIRLSDYATEQVTVDELKSYLQVEGTAYDSQFETIIKQARGIVELATSISLVDHEVILKAHIDKPLRLPMSPLDEATDVRYRKCPSVLTPAVEDEDYQIEDDTFIPLRSKPCGWVIDYTTTATDIEQLIEAVKIQAAWMYTNRDSSESSIAPQAQALIDAYKIGNY